MLNNKFIYIGKNPAWPILHKVFLTRLQFVLKDTVLENFYLCTPPHKDNREHTQEDTRVFQQPLCLN